MGNESIDLGLRNIWETWFEFKKGKRFTSDLNDFQYHLEQNLHALFKDLNNRTYRHRGYRKFIVCDNKRREISVANVRDRLVHRLIYDYLNPIYDKIFIFDAWSCRRNKGLLGAIERAQRFLELNPHGFIWKGDVKKFFDSVDQQVLLSMIALKIHDLKALYLLQEIIFNYSSFKGERKGMPIGNLTSQIFANIYLNELDRFVKHWVKPKAYLRYGDDFIVIETDLKKLKFSRTKTIDFLNIKLKLQMNMKSNKIIKAAHGLKFLGVKLWPSGRTLNRRNHLRIKEKLKMNNISSYSGLITKHGNVKQMKYFNWLVYEKIFTE